MNEERDPPKPEDALLARLRESVARMLAIGIAPSDIVRRLGDQGFERVDVLRELGAASSTTQVFDEKRSGEAGPYRSGHSDGGTFEMHHRLRLPDVVRVRERHAPVDEVPPPIDGPVTVRERAAGWLVAVVLVSPCLIAWQPAVPYLFTLWAGIAVFATANEIRRDLRERALVPPPRIVDLALRLTSEDVVIGVDERSTTVALAEVARIRLLADENLVLFDASGAELGRVPSPFVRSLELLPRLARALRQAWNGEAPTAIPTEESVRLLDGRLVDARGVILADVREVRNATLLASRRASPAEDACLVIQGGDDRATSVYLDATTALRFLALVESADREAPRSD